MRKPSKLQTIKTLLSAGIPINSVIDVGMLNDTYELRTLLSAKNQLLVEPINEWNKRLTDNYKSSGVNFKIVNVAASDFDGKMNMRTSTVVEGKDITHARLTSSDQGSDLREVTVRKLDTLCAEHSSFLPSPHLLKIDVDGVEVNIIKGATEVLKSTSVVIIEAGVHNFVERSQLMIDRGFCLFDLSDICYYDGWLKQVDMTFVRKEFYRRFDPYVSGFDIAKWQQYSS
jgi:FkbM family methyltransferase